jgi:hypothetical protein
LSFEAATDALIVPSIVKGSNILSSHEPCDETFALVPSLHQGHTSIGTALAIFLVA